MVKLLHFKQDLKFVSVLSIYVVFSESWLHDLYDFAWTKYNILTTWFCWPCCDRVGWWFRGRDDLYVTSEFALHFDSRGYTKHVRFKLMYEYISTIEHPCRKSIFLARYIDNSDMSIFTAVPVHFICSRNLHCDYLLIFNNNLFKDLF